MSDLSFGPKISGAWDFKGFQNLLVGIINWINCKIQELDIGNKFPLLNRQNSEKNKDAKEMESSQENNEDCFEALTNIRAHSPGLRNLGNTCYLNSVLQILAHTPLFIEKLLPSSNELAKKLWYILQLLSAEYSDEEDVFKSLKCFKITLDCCMPIFSGHSQNDAKLLLAMINSQVESTVFLQNIQKTFEHKSSESNHTFISQESSIFTIISHEYSNSVQGYFDNFEEMVYEFTGTNQLYCENCGAERDMIMKTQIIGYPEVLILYYVKSQREIFTKDVPDTILIKSNEYKLYGLICHSGSIFAGHYWAYVLSEQNNWIEYNDYMVRIVDAPDFMHAYLAFYNKIK